MKNEEIKIINTTGRNNCGGRCIIHAHVQNGKVVKLTTDTAEDAGENVPLRACARGMHYHETFLDESQRLMYPMLRVGKRGEGKFHRISWDEALDRIAEQWVRIRDTYGVGSRYVNYATGVSAALRPDSMMYRLLNLDGGYLGRYNSYSSACTTQATKLMYGTGDSGESYSHWLHSKLIILWGHNPAETKFDCETMYYLRAAKRRGTPIVVVDPRYSDTACELDAEWIPIRPATDAAMLDAMAYVVVRNGLQDQDFLDRCCLGFDSAHLPEGVPGSESYLSYLLGEKDGVAKTPQWAAEICGVPAETIEYLALRYAKAKPAALVQGYGPQRHSYGEQPVRSGIALACMTGNVGVLGGWACGHGSYEGHMSPGLPVGTNPYGMKIPSFCWTEAIERGAEMGEIDGVTGGKQLKSDIKMMFNLAGNTLINQHSDINATAKLLQDETKCEFIVCSDVFMTASAKFADILLPGVSFFECENITMPWGNSEFLGYNNKVIDPLGEGRFEYDWIAELAARLGLYNEFTLGRTAEEWLQAMYEETRKVETELPEFEEFKKAGIYRYKNEKSYVAFAENRRDPEAHPFNTPSGKIEIFSPKVYITQYRDPFPAIPGYVEPIEGANDPLAEKWPLQLIGWHTKRRCHSIHDNTPALEKLDPQTLRMHPADAEVREIVDGDTVEIRNDRGVSVVPVTVTEDIMPGVVALAQGAWYRPDENGVDRNGSINIFTSLHPTPYARGNPQHTNLVEVRKWTE